MPALAGVAAGRVVLGERVQRSTVYRAELVPAGLDLSAALRIFPRTNELGWCDFFVDRAYLYCGDRTSWFAYDRDRGVYLEDRDHKKIDEAIALCVKVLNAIARELPDTDPFRDGRVKFAHNLQSRAQRHGLRNDLESRLSVRATDLDPLPDPDLILTPAQRAAREAAVFQICTPAGVYDLKIGELLPHDPKYRHTKQTAVGYDPKAPNDPDLEFIFSTMFGHLTAEDFARLFEILGTALLGESVLKFLASFVGEAHSLKSSFLNIMAAILYAGSLETEVLLAQRNGGKQAHTDWLRSAIKARFVVVQEFPAYRQIDESALKRLVGGDALRYSGKNEKGYDVRLVATIATGSNSPLSLNAEETAAWERIGLISLPNSVPPDKMKPDYKTTLARRPSVQAHLFRLLVEGAWRYIARGTIEIPAVLLEARDEERGTQNPYTEFFEECLEFGSEYTFTMDLLADCARCWNSARKARISTHPQKIASTLRTMYKAQSVTDRNANGGKLRGGDKSNGACYWVGARLRVEWGKEAGGEFVRALSPGEVPRRVEVGPRYAGPGEPTIGAPTESTAFVQRVVGREV